MKTFTTKTTRILLISTLLISTVGLAQSQKPQGNNKQEKQGPPPIPDATQIKQMVSDLSSELNLSTEQITKISALYTEHFKQVKQKVENQRPKREEMESLKTSFENSVKVALTKEQKVKYVASLKKKTARKNTHEMKPPRNN